MLAHIFKYEIPITDEIIELDMPDNNALCDIQAQGDKIMAWCVVDIHAKLVKRKFKVVGTGHQFKIDELYFLRTVQMPNGLVWHIFEVEK